ncbi:MAG: ankyrin repeat domain-containing protein [Rhodocyclaceae bacterium]
MSTFPWRWFLAWIAVTIGAPAHAGFFDTSCAGRTVAKAYHDENAVALVRAATRGDVDEIALLSSKYPHVVNHVEDKAVPPLLWAICADNVKGFEALLIAGANPNLGGGGIGPGDGKGHGLKEDGSVIASGWTATIMASSAGNIEFLKLALRYGAELNSPKGVERPDLPLSVAAYYGLFDHVKLLIENGADINGHDSLSGAPEYAIVSGGRFDIAMWLVENGYTWNLQRLASIAEIRQVPLKSSLQRSKDALIDVLRQGGAVFPASPNTKFEFQERVIPDADFWDVIRGYKWVGSYPKRQAAPRE